MKKLLFAALAVLALFSAPASAAQTQIAALVLSACATLPAGVTYAAGTYGILTMDTTGKLCDSATGGGGGGGLSVTDSASWTAGSSQFTPSGGEYNPTATALTSGQQGTLALDANRAAMVDTPTTGNNLYNALTAAAPAFNATAWNTNTYSNGATSPINTDLHGALWGDLGAIGGNLLSCTSHGFKHITSATDTFAVQGVTSQTIRLCAWRARAAGTATWYFENTASTNANCGSTLTQISGVATEAANTGEVVSLPLGTSLPNTSGNGLCINSTGTGGVDIDYWYGQAP